MHAAIAVARDAGVLVSFDVNLTGARCGRTRRRRRKYAKVVERADVVLAPTEEEARLVVDAPDAVGLARELAGCGAAHVLVKRGADGAVAMVDGELYRVAAVPVTAVDPVGAGDAFGAAYLSVLCRGGSVEERLRLLQPRVRRARDREGLPAGRLPLPGGRGPHPRSAGVAGRVPSWELITAFGRQSPGRSDRPESVSAWVGRTT